MPAGRQTGKLAHRKRRRLPPELLFFSSVRVFNARSGSVGVSHERGKHEREPPETLDWQAVARKNNVKAEDERGVNKTKMVGLPSAPPRPSHHLKVEFPWDGSHQPFQTGEPLQGHRVIRRASRFSLHSAKVTRFQLYIILIYVKTMITLVGYTLLLCNTLFLLIRVHRNFSRLQMQVFLQKNSNIQCYLCFFSFFFFFYMVATNMSLRGCAATC